jgi:hypothetical protein
MYILFKTTNMLNGREWWGVHATDDMFFGTRDAIDPHIGDGMEISRDLRRQGRHTFHVEAIQAFADREEAYKHCKRHIDSASNKSYHTKPFNQALSDTHKGNTYRLGAIHTPESIERIRVVTTGENNPMYGKKHSPETLEKLVEHRKKVRWVHNPKKNTEKQVDLSVEDMPKGFQLGRLPKKKSPTVKVDTITSQSTTPETEKQ